MKKIDKEISYENSIKFKNYYVKYKNLTGLNYALISSFTGMSSSYLCNMIMAGKRACYEEDIYNFLIGFKDHLIKIRSQLDNDIKDFENSFK